MPIALEPKNKFKVVLESDQKKAPDQQPYFEFKFLSGRDWKSLCAEADKLESKKFKGGADAIDAIFKLLGFGLVGWSGMIDPKTNKAIPYNLKELDRLLTIDEASELVQKFKNQGVEVDERKNSDSPSD